MGARAREMRVARNLTLKEAAAAAQELGSAMTFADLSNIERGTRRWNLEYVVVMAAVYGVDPAAFFIDIQEQGLLRAWRSEGARGVLAWLLEHVPKDSK